MTLTKHQHNNNKLPILALIVEALYTERSTYGQLVKIQHDYAFNNDIKCVWKQ